MTLHYVQGPPPPKFWNDDSAATHVLLARNHPCPECGWPVTWQYQGKHWYACLRCKWYAEGWFVWHRGCCK